MKSSKLSFIKVWKSVFFVMFFCLAGLWSLAGCENQNKPSYIFIAIDHLGFNSLTCNEEKVNSPSGLNILCKEALRFTHAYTTSLQPAAAMASLLTAEYPFEHQLHRSTDRISKNSILISELAYKNKYRTAFFSGSPAILKKTGLSKGFEIFDDTSFLEKKNYLADFKKQSELFLTWSQESPQAFLGFIYNSELESLNEAETETSAYEKFDEKLADFFENLKNRNQWENNFIILVGLQGQSDYYRPNETAFSNLHSENTNIVVFVKPPRQKGDDGTNWKIDNTINLADLGYSLFKTIEPQFLKTLSNDFEILDFSYLWKTESKSDKNFHNQETSMNSDRKILIESMNPWTSHNESRFAILYKNYLHIENHQDELYNVLNDGLETINLANTSQTIHTDYLNINHKLYSEIRLKQNQSKWNGLSFEMNLLVNSNKDYWLKPNSRAELLEKEFLQFKAGHPSHPLTVLMIQNLILKNKTEQLKEIGIHFDTKKISNSRDNYLEEARRQSINLSLENLWGIWKKNKDWTQSKFTSAYQ